MSALTPRPGIMKIAPYVPGKDSVEGRETIAKLSSNEGALGPLGQRHVGLADHAQGQIHCDAEISHQTVFLVQFLTSRHPAHPSRLRTITGQEELSKAGRD